MRVSHVCGLESRLMLLEPLVFPLLAGALSGTQRFGHIRESQRAITLSLMTALKILLCFKLLETAREVDGRKILTGDRLGAGYR